MDGEAWRATVHGVARVGRDLVTKLLLLLNGKKKKEFPLEKPKGVLITSMAPASLPTEWRGNFNLRN